jgi:hypothetical protein
LAEDDDGRTRVFAARQKAFPQQGQVERFVLVFLALFSAMKQPKDI